MFSSNMYTHVVLDFGLETAVRDGTFIQPVMNAKSMTLNCNLSLCPVGAVTDATIIPLHTDSVDFSLMALQVAP